MIVLFTDFGMEGPYTGQMKAVLLRLAPRVPVIDLFADAPAFDAKRSAYLLAAHASAFPAGTVLLAVVDPGVGGARPALAAELDGRWFVGPDNGLVELLWRRSRRRRAMAISWRPLRLSCSFHGRDLFAPVAARLALGELPAGETLRRPDPKAQRWPDDLAEIVYIDRYGNGMTGLRADMLDAGAVLAVNGHELKRARTFGSVDPGSGFWYENSNGLVEIAANQARAARIYGLRIGDRVRVHMRAAPRAGRSGNAKRRG
ncbi:MAG: SAM-dependent chlorinase/fluorinase [Proteobacteria bacterium]|nr:SAM-dependent chlorinase/fluorinase [Pseudomonadota bacterium]MBI3497777.1 SAM-dependent chlorinase/fluorinase [Pseudomonadota bacterium]